MERWLEALPAVVRRARLHRGLSLRAAARAGGVSASSWSRWERGERAGSLAFVSRVARGLGVQVDTLLVAARLAHDAREGEQR